MSDPTEVASVLAQLRDIHLPGPVSAWPPAPGYYVLGVFLLMLCLMLKRLSVQYQKGRFKREALSLLDALEQSYQNKPESADKRTDKRQVSQHIASEVSSLIRRVALVYYPRSDVASLHGKNWLNFLEQHQKKTSPISLEVVHETLINAPYQPDANVDLLPLFQYVKHWIKAQKGSLYV